MRHRGAAKAFGTLFLMAGLAACGGAAPAGSPAAASPSSAGASPASASAKPATSAAASGSAAAKPADNTVVKLATNPVSPSNGFAWITQEQGYFAKNGVNVDLEGMGGSQRSNAIVAGQIDGEVGGGPQEYVAARAQGRDLIVIAAFSNKFDDVVVAPTSVTDSVGLRGKKIGAVLTTSVDAQGLVMYLRKSGLEPGKDYSLISTGSAGSQATAAAALSTHQVDAAALQADFGKGVVQNAPKDFHILVDLVETDLPLPGVNIDFRGEFVKQHPDLVQKILDSLIQGVRYTKEHPAETKASWAKRYQIDDSAAQRHRLQGRDRLHGHDSPGSRQAESQRHGRYALRGRR